MDYFNKFTEEARKVLVIAQEEAKKMNLSYIGTEHILIGILKSANSLGGNILDGLNIKIDAIYQLINAAGPRQEPSKEVLETGLSDLAKKVVEDSVQVAHKFNHTYVGTEHLLYALVTQGETAATIILKSLNIDVKIIAKNIEKIFNTSPNKKGEQSFPNALNSLDSLFNKVFGDFFGQRPGGAPGQRNSRSAVKDATGKKEESDTPALDYFTVDFTKLAEENKLDPVIGREKEITRMLAILNRRRKNNPILIGEAGVGKTAVVEGLALRIIAGKVPAQLHDKKLLTLDLAALVAGTKYRGEFEERIKSIISEARSRGDVILFIDEIHTMIGAGGAEGTLDAANILKPALSRGEIQIIGATTIDEYTKHIEKDHAVERRFQPIMIEEPSIPDSLEIIRGLKTVIEDHHNVKITEEAIKASVHMSKRYIGDRYLPDKAIDLIDEACSLKGISVKVPPNKAKKIKKQIEGIIKKKEEAVSKQNYEKAAELREKELKIQEELEQEMKQEKEKITKRNISIKEEDIALVVSQMTGVPTLNLMKSDVDKLKKLEDTLRAHIVGQDEAITEIAKSIRRSRTGIASADRPIGSFIFIGPSGVGKTELVKKLEKEVYETDDALIKIDMSEFSDRHTAARLVGAPAGYVGHEEGGQLINKVRKKPYSIVLFDEIEKAHPDVLNILLQIMEDGELTDGKGRKANFRNCIIIMTSNIGAQRLTDQNQVIGFVDDGELKKEEKKYDEIKEMVLEELRDQMLPEFLNRLDKIVVFRPLTHKTLVEIAKLQVQDLEERLKDKSLTLKVQSKVYEKLVDELSNTDSGARPIRTAVREFIEYSISEGLLDGSIKEGGEVDVKIVKGKIVVK